MVLKHVCKQLHLLRSAPSKPFLAMRFTTIFIFAGFLHVSARCYTQEKINLSEKKATLEKIFSKIRQQTGYSIWYDEAVLGKSAGIDLELKDASLQEALDDICRSLPLTYTIVGKMVVITAREEKNTNSPPPLDVKGKVMNEKGEPLPGATIGIKGSIRSIQADANGEFVLTGLDENAILVVSNVGYQTQELKAVSGIRLIIRLIAAVSKLDEVQVIAYGTTTQRLSTGSISKVSAEEIARQPVSNPLEALEGRMAGVFIQQSTGVPGGGIMVQVRGQNSLRNSPSDNGNLPLYIIDGVPYTSNSIGSGISGGVLQEISPMNSLNISDIESINVLKDADATAIYGSRGSNGVVLITTKKGVAGKSKIDINSYAGLGKVTRMMKLLNTQQYLQMREEAFANDREPFQSYNYDVNGVWDKSRYTDWQKVLLGGDAKTSNIQGSVSGGNEFTQFLFGVGYYRQSTVFPGEFSDQKGSGHLNINHSSENHKFRINVSASYMSDHNNLPELDLTSVAIILPPDAPALYDLNGNLNWENSTWLNPIAFDTYKKYRSITENFISSVNLSYNLEPALQFRANVGYTNMNLKELQTSPIKAQNPARINRTGSTSFANNNINTWIIEPQVEYKKNIMGGSFSILLGTTFQENIEEGQTIYATGYTSDALLENLQAAAGFYHTANYTQYKYEAFFSRVNYNWREKCIVNLTGRRDGSSRFGPDRQFGNFGAAGIAWIFLNEKLAKHNFSALSFGKLRASYGITGSDQIPDYGYLDTYSATNYPYQGVSGLYPTRLVNPDYSWETNKKFETALELGFLKDRILFTGRWYRNRSSNQLVGYQLPILTSQASVEFNLPATVQNTGFEFELTGSVLKSKELTWTTGLNITIPRNKLISYPNLEGSSYVYKYKLGQPLDIAIGFHQTTVDPQTGVYQFADKDGKTTDSPIFPDDYVYVKKKGQYFYGGFQNALSFKGFQLNIFIQFVKQSGENYLNSFQIPGSYGNQPAFVTSRWQKPGDMTNIQMFTQDHGSPAANAYYNALGSDKNISDASYVRLKNLSLSYSLPGKWLNSLKFQACRFYINGQNLFTITRYLGLDPENQTGTMLLPPLRVISAGFSLTF